MKRVRIDLTGMQFGRLTVVEYSYTNSDGKDRGMRPLAVLV